MLKSQLKNKILAVLNDHLDGVVDEDDIDSILNDLVDEISYRNRDIEDDDKVFKADDLDFYEQEELDI